MSDDAQGESAVSAALGHPIRARIVEVANEREISAIQFVNEQLTPDGFSWKHQENAISNVAYHFRVLEKAGCIRKIREVPRRGATEFICLGAAALLPAEEEPVEPRRVSKALIQGLVARIEGAVTADTFDARDTRHLTVRPLELDNRGWDEFIGLLDHCLAEVEQINSDASDRLAASGEEVIPATFGMLGFQSPVPPPIANPDSTDEPD